TEVGLWADLAALPAGSRRTRRRARSTRATLGHPAAAGRWQHSPHHLTAPVSLLGEDVECEGDALAAADAQRDDAALETVASHRVDETGRQHGAGPSDRMAMRNRASLDIDDILRQTELAHYSNGDRRKGLGQQRAAAHTTCRRPRSTRASSS